MRALRRVFDILLPVAGTVLILGALLFVIQLRVQIVLALVGILLVQAGVWRLADPFLPNERKYLPLRHEVDGFIALVRRLNAAALELRARAPAAEERFQGTCREMLDSVDRMVAVAGKTKEEVAATGPGAQQR